MSDSLDIRRAVRKAIDEVLKKPVKGKTLCEAVEEAVARAVGIERERIERCDSVLVTSDRVLTRSFSDSLDKLFDTEVKSTYIN
jgi:FixJ family two-component response regulator